MGPADPQPRRGRIMSEKCIDVINTCKIVESCEVDLGAECPAHKPDLTSKGQVGSSGLLVPASQGSNAKPDRFTAGPIGARRIRNHKPCGACLMLHRCHGYPLISVKEITELLI